jgi:acyl carrier protein phosphodiesterase
LSSIRAPATFSKKKKRAEKIKLDVAQDHTVSKKCTQDKGENESTEKVSRKEKKEERKSRGHVWVLRPEELHPWSSCLLG